MDSKVSRGGFSQKRNYNARDGNQGNQRMQKAFGGRRQEGYLTAQNVKETQENDSDLDENQDALDDEDFEIIPPTWNAELIAIGYDKNRIECPNIAVQTILYCIKNLKVHEIILEKEAIRTPEQFSAVTHLGFSEWLLLLPKINKLSDKEEDVVPFITCIYEGLPEKIFNWTKIEDKCTSDFVMGITALEDANDIKNTHANDGELARMDRPELHTKNALTDDDLFGADILTEEDKAVLQPNTSLSSNVMDIEFKFNLKNCLKFPIIPHRLVESHGLLCNQALWRTKNFGALAPISEDAWMILGGLTKEKIHDAKAAAFRMQRMKRTRIKLTVKLLIL